MKTSFAVLMLSHSCWAALPTCEGLCEQIFQCKDSYCKTNNVCFGLYRRPDGSVCDFQSDSSCPQSSPVSCPVVATTVAPTTFLSSTVAEELTSTSGTIEALTLVNASSIPSHWLGSCDTLCEFTPGCLRIAQGSYCKAWSQPGVCFALFWTSSAKDAVCTPGGIPGTFCPSTYPVLCSEVGEAV